MSDLNELLYILTIKGTKSDATRKEIIDGMTARGATITLAQSRIGDFEVMLVNSQAVARVFKTEAARFEYFKNSLKRRK